MGSTSFWGFSYPNLLVFLDLLLFRNLFIDLIFLSVLIFLYIVYFVFDSKHAVGTAGIRRKNICPKKKGKRQFFLSD